MNRYNSASNTSVQIVGPSLKYDDCHFYPSLAGRIYSSEDRALSEIAQTITRFEGSIRSMIKEMEACTDLEIKTHFKNQIDKWKKDVSLAKKWSVQWT